MTIEVPMSNDLIKHPWAYIILAGIFKLLISSAKCDVTLNMLKCCCIINLGRGRERTKAKV